MSAHTWYTVLGAIAGCFTGVCLFGIRAIIWDLADYPPSIVDLASIVLMTIIGTLVWSLWLYPHDKSKEERRIDSDS